MKKLAILGASGHGKVVADIAASLGWAEIVFFDDAWPQKNSLGPWQVVGNTETLLLVGADCNACFVAIGDNAIRHQKQKLLRNHGAVLATLIHPRAVVSSYATLGVGTVVMAGVVINPFAQIGEACIVNTGAIIEHDCRLDHAVHISPRVALAGGVEVGYASWLGIGSCVKQLIKIGTHVMVGAGSVVVEDVPGNSVVVGVPARSLL